MDAHMHLMHGPGFFAHVRGMWIAFSITAAFIVLFLGQLRHAIEVSERREQALREARDRGRRLASLATLAGGAAHELATPLSTIALIAEGLGKDARLAGTDDVRLLGTEVERCVSVLRQLSVDAGTPGGEQPVVGAVGPYLEALREAPRVRVRASAAAVVRVPPRAFASALRGLVKNALQASAEDVNLEAAVDGDDVVVTVRDRGAGIDEVTLQRIGEPFFTTKDMGNGMGLGVFLARTVIEQCGGRFEIASVVGVGTTVTVTLPQAAT
jgi:two-component system sensor histidine kinase RegB